MKKEPSITVLMSVYNSEAYLQEAIESILNQSFPDFEFLIVNDASIDRSRQIILSYQDPRIRLIDNPENLGLTKSLNKGLALAEGQYIARMDADDISHPQRLAKQLAYMEQNENVDVVGSWGWIVDDKGIVWGDLRPYVEFEDIFVQLFFSNCMIHSSTFFRKEVIMRLGGYDTAFVRAQDYGLWVKIISNLGKITNIPEYLVKYRNHHENITNQFFENQEFYAQKAMAAAFRNIINQEINPELFPLLHNPQKDTAAFLRKKNEILDVLTRLREYLETRFSGDGIALGRFHLISNSFREIFHSEEGRDRLKCYYDLLSYWLKNRNEGQLIGAYLERNNFKTIAIYGAGVIGLRLYEELIKFSHIDILGMIDQRADSCPEGIPWIDIDAVNTQFQVDCIIVTPIYCYEDITANILKKGFRGKVISIKDIVYTIAGL